MVKKLIYLIVSCLFLSQLQAQEIKTFNTWALTCIESAKCNISQAVAADANAKHIILGASVNYFLGAKYPALLLRLPPNTYKSAGIGIKVDDHPPIRVKIAQCNPQYCESMIKMDAELIQQMQTGQVALIAIALEDKKQRTLPLSLQGFAEAFSELSKTL